MGEDDKDDEDDENDQEKQISSSKKAVQGLLNGEPTKEQEQDLKQEVIAEKAQVVHNEQEIAQLKNEVHQNQGKQNEVQTLEKEVQELKQAVNSHIQTPVDKAHGANAKTVPVTTLQNGDTKLHVQPAQPAQSGNPIVQVAKEEMEASRKPGDSDQVANTRALRKKARNVLRAQSKAIPAILAKGTLDNLMQKGKQPAKLGESNTYNEADLDDEDKKLKTELEDIGKRTKAVAGAHGLPAVTIKLDASYENKRMAQKDAYVKGEIRKARREAQEDSAAKQEALTTMHQTNMAAALTATAKTNAYKTQLSVVTDAADAAVQAQEEHEAKLKSAKDRMDRNYKELQQEREGMKDYTVTDNVHHNGESAEEAAQDAEDDLELGESQDGDTLASMKKALAATKKQASEGCPGS